MHDFLITLVRNSIYMSILALSYMAVTPLFSKHYVSKWRYYAWLIIVIGFIIPFRPSLEIPLLESKVVISPSDIQQGIGINISEDVSQTMMINSNISLSSLWIFILWIIGVVAFIVYHSIRHYHFIGTVKRWSEEISEPKILEILNNLQEELKINNQVKLLYCFCITTPMMIGFINSVILLPSKDVHLDELLLILKHELIHFKRKDLWYKGLVFLATAIHWFNPVVYLIAREIALQCEISCDAEVVKDTDMDKRQQYSQTIISAIKDQSRMKTTFSTNFYKGERGIKNRIISIMDIKEKKKGVTIICLVIIGVMMADVSFTANSDIKPIEDNGTMMSMSYYDEGVEKNFYSWDDGKTWVSLTGEEYDVKFPSVEIEWWTYDGYKEWLDNEKIQLRDIIGERGWNQSEGWYIWTQEMVDETIKMYEETLKDIENGIMYSKSVDGDENISMSYDLKDIDTDTEHISNYSLDKNKGRK